MARTGTSGGGGVAKRAATVARERRLEGAALQAALRARCAVTGLELDADAASPQRLTFLRPDRVACAAIVDMSRFFPIAACEMELRQIPLSVRLPGPGERVAARERLRARAARALSEARGRSRREDVQMNDGYVRELVWRSAGRCWLTGVEMTAERGPRQLSLDRIDSAIPGYQYGNVQPVCLWANIAKRDRDCGKFLGFVLRCLGQDAREGDRRDVRDELPADDVRAESREGAALGAHDVLGDRDPADQPRGLGPAG